MKTLFTSACICRIVFTSHTVFTLSIGFKPFLRLSIMAFSSFAEGYPIDSLIMNLSICESGRSDVPDAPVGFCVAITVKGFGSIYVLPSTVTLPSSMASRSADCVRVEARFNSSARKRLWNIEPGWYFIVLVFLSYSEKPVISEGNTSGVNWTLP